MRNRERSGKLLSMMALMTTFGFTHLRSFTGLLSSVCGDQRIRHDCSAPPGIRSNHPFSKPTHSWPPFFTLLSPNLSLNSAAVAAPTRPPDPFQLPSPSQFPSETNSLTPASPTSIPLRWCQNSHHLLPNCREENHLPRRSMSFHSNLLAENVHGFVKAREI